MLTPEEVLAVTGHPVGGVSPFGLATALPVYCDISLKAFDEVVPAAGSTNSALRINPIRMAELLDAEWVESASKTFRLNADRRGTIDGLYPFYSVASSCCPSIRELAHCPGSHQGQDYGCFAAGNRPRC